jgi:hypothetical protein
MLGRDAAEAPMKNFLGIGTAASRCAPKGAVGRSLVWWLRIRERCCQRRKRRVCVRLFSGYESVELCHGVYVAVPA